MTDLLQAIYQYAHSTLSLPTREEEKLFRETGECSERAQQKLTARLSEEDRARFQSCLDDMTILHSLELEAMFLSGLSIGMELSRL